ncbi:RAD50 interactor 1 isoform X3 [Rhodnius prolixus]
MLTQIRERMQNTEKFYYEMKDYFEKIDQFSRFRSCLLVLECVQQVSDKIEGHIVAPDIDKAIDEYKKLMEVCLKLRDSKCEHIQNFVFETTKYWNGILKKELSADLEVAMKNIQWPVVSSNSLITSPAPDALSKFQICLRRLLQVQLQSELEEKPVVSSTLQVTFPPLSLPATLLIVPLRKRFIYHFTGSRQTNRIDKPEWYFTQILTWIRDHEHFVMNSVQPVYDDLNVDKLAVVELMSGLVELSVEKLQTDMEQIQYDDLLFSHTVDEALAFEKELRHSYMYPSSLPGPVHVLTQAQLFVKWIRMERKYARDKMDAIMSSETAWSTLGGLPDEEKITEVAHTFLALLTTMTDRYSLLPQPGHKLQFVELELELIDDFRVSLLQVLHTEHNDPLNSKLPQVLNTISYLRNALEEFDASPTMLLLDHYRRQYKNEEIKENEVEGMFRPSLILLERLEDQLLDELAQALMMEVKARSRPYRKYRWFSLTDSDFDPTTPTPAACPLLQVLTSELHNISEKLSEKMFVRFWKLMAKNLNIFFLEEIVLENHFNPIGGEVLQNDVNKFLIPLFQHFTKTPQVYFSEIKEACSLLSLVSVPANVQRFVLTGNHQELMRNISIPIKALGTEQVANVLMKRIDIAPSLM